MGFVRSNREGGWQEKRDGNGSLDLWRLILVAQMASGVGRYELCRVQLKSILLK